MLARSVGRSALPSNVFGLLFHCAEHTHRHTGQLVTTSKIVILVGPAAIERTTDTRRGSR
jgi:hypothetical protein